MTGVDPHTRRAMQGNRSRDTKPELLVRSLLHRRGLRFRVAQRPIIAIRRTADIVFTRAKVAVFIDGCFWHGCPDHYRQPSTNITYWIAKVERNVRRDVEVDEILRAAGWTVVRVWEHENPVEVSDRIESAVHRSWTSLIARPAPAAVHPSASECSP
jgi:DNA mismatch endonuclease (patch repair protein)